MLCPWLDCTSCSEQLETITTHALVCLKNILDLDPRDARALALKSIIHAQQYRSDLQARGHHVELAVKAVVQAGQVSDGAGSSVYWAMR